VLKLLVFWWNVNYEFILADGFFHLDRPLVRVTGVDVPTPYAFNLEEICFPKTHNIVEAVKSVLKWLFIINNPSINQFYSYSLMNQTYNLSYINL
jgi:hypothetical protein